MKVQLVLLVALVASTPIACGGSDSSATSADAGADAAASQDGAADGASTDASADGSADTGTSGDAGACGPGHFGGGETKSVAGTVKAKIVDENGAPVSGQVAYVCGIDLCTAPAMTDGTGSATVNASMMMKKPAFKYGDGVAYAELAIPLAAAGTDFTSGGKLLATGKLSDKQGAALTPGTSATSGGVTIAIPSGATVGIDTLVYDTPDKQLFRSVLIPLANLAQVFAPVQINGAAADFKVVYGVAPAETPICPRAKVTAAVPGAVGWAAGTAVEFWVMTTDTGQQYAPYAGWAKMSDGVVRQDGAAETVDGQGFSFLETFAIRKK